jgi:AhpD family alkylhydroperoxidase
MQESSVAGGAVSTPADGLKLFTESRRQRPIFLCYYLRMATTTTENPVAERAVTERSTPERKEPTYLFTEKYVSEKSEIARKFLDTRERLNSNVEKANNFLVKRFYNVDHNTYLEGALSAKTKELMGLVASACLRCDDCIFYHAIQAYRLGVTRAEQEESLSVALVVGGSIVVPHLRRAYELLEEMYG